MGAIRDAHTQEFGFSQWLHSISGLDSPQPRGRRRQSGPCAPPPGAPRAPPGLLPPAAPRRRRAAAAGPGSRAPPPTPGGRGRRARGGELGARPGEAAGDGVGGEEWGGGSVSERRWRRRCPACSRLPGPRSARCISPPQVRGRCAARLHLTLAFCKLITCKSLGDLHHFLAQRPVNILRPFLQKTYFSLKVISQAPPSKSIKVAFL